MRARWLFAAALAVGCDSSPPPKLARTAEAIPEESPHDRDCDALAGRSIEQTLAKIPADAPADVRAMMSRMASESAVVLARVCKADGWSDEILRCGIGAADGHKCAELLTPEQKTHLTDEINRARQPAAP